MISKESKNLEIWMSAYEILPGFDSKCRIRLKIRRLVDAGL